ncbi:MAG TPA: proline--tRNA ligase, partial [Clostridiaceae bacterium]|nr:proline--tRNA ligase [Clostridiaceae bacterium]
MEKEKKLVEAITSMEEDFAQWYTDIVKKADLVAYSSVKGCMIIRPYGYAIWELIQKELDRRFKETGHENVYMPMFIPESLLQKEKDHVEGFAPEVAWVTHGGSEKLAERLCVRPTSETLFCDHYKDIVQSYRDLPKLYNQWCSVVRWEKTTRPFLRSVEFLWQEGHTVHATAEEAQEETIRMLNVYASFCEEVLAIPVIKGQKTEKEKFAGAKATYTIESLMHDGKALQTGTSHNFGDGFARAFGIQYLDRDNKLKYAHQTSWGMSTRLIGALIMVHGDDSGLVLPPRVAPVQVIIVPVQQHVEGVLDKAYELKERLSKVCRVKVDDSDKMPGWKFAEHEMRGVPLRLEIGPKDIQKNQVVLVKRENREKLFVSIDELEARIPAVLDEIQASLYNKALSLRNTRTFTATTLDEMEKILNETPGF